MRKLSEKPSYRWVIVAVCFLMVFVALGFCSSTKSLYLAAITNATGIRRGLFSISDSCRFLTTAVVNLFFGTLIKRFGSKKLIIAGFVSLIMFALIYANTDSVFGFCLGGFFLGLGLSWTTTSMVGHVVNVWCKERRGTVMGLILAANGIGGALAVQIVSPIIYHEGDAYGYRLAYLLTAVILATVAIIVLLFFKDRPAKSDISADENKKKPRENAWIGINARTALRTPYFYAVAVGIFFTGFTLQAINGVATAHMKDVGLDVGYIAAIFSCYSITLTMCKLINGMLYDKIGLRKLILICDITTVVSIILLALVRSTSGGKALALSYSLLSAFAMPLDTIMLPLITADMFGEQDYEKLLGIFVSVNTAGYALSMPLTNLCYDIIGTYVPALIALSIIMAGVTVLNIFVISDATRKRMEIEQSHKTDNNLASLKLFNNLKVR